MTYNKLTALCIAVLISLVSYAQDITVTIEKQLPAAVHTLDFITVLDEASVKALQEEGLNVEVHSAILSSGGSKYHCSVSGVTQDVYKALDSRWRVQLADAEFANPTVKNQDDYMTEAYKELISEAKAKAAPLAMAMDKKLGNLENIEILDYSDEVGVSSDNPFAGYMSAKIEAGFSCVD